MKQSISNEINGYFIRQFELIELMVEDIDKNYLHNSEYINSSIKNIYDLNILIQPFSDNIYNVIFYNWEDLEIPNALRMSENRNYFNSAEIKQINIALTNIKKIISEIELQYHLQ